MSLIGIGTATVSVKVNQKEFVNNKKIDGILCIEGGLVDQHIKRVEHDLIMIDGDNGDEVILETNTILTSKTIKPGGTYSFPFCYCLLNLNISDQQFRLRTRLFFDRGFKTEEHDILQSNMDEEF
jgi:sporulation-control protein spo0M